MLSIIFWVVFAIVVFGFLDSGRDSWNEAKYKRPHGVIFWGLTDKWHLIKHLGYYGSCLAILYGRVPMMWWLPLGFAVWIVWYACAKFIWKAHWLQ